MKNYDKDRVTVNLSKDVLKRVDALVDGKSLRNRSHAVESLLVKQLKFSGVSTALILAGGEGMRLRPFTYEIPKPMLPVQGKPILEYVVRLLKKYDVNNVIFAVNYKGEKVKEYFGDGSRFGVNVSYVEEKKPLGTGGCLRLAKDLLLDRFLMFNGDNLTNINLADMQAFHLRQGKKATVALSAVSDPSGFGVAELNGNLIERFVEKPKKPESNLINSGAYIFEPEIIDLVPKGKVSLERQVFPKLVKEKEMSGYVYNGQWFPTDTHQRYEKAIKEWKGII